MRSYFSEHGWTEEELKIEREYERLLECLDMINEYSAETWEELKIFLSAPTENT